MSQASNHRDKERLSPRRLPARRASPRRTTYLQLLVDRAGLVERDIRRWPQHIIPQGHPPRVCDLFVELFVHPRLVVEERVLTEELHAMALQLRLQLVLGPLDRQNADAVLLPGEALHHEALGALDVEGHVVYGLWSVQLLQDLSHGLGLHLHSGALGLVGFVVEIVAHDAAKDVPEGEGHLLVGWAAHRSEDHLALPALRKAQHVLGVRLHADAAPTVVSLEHQGVGEFYCVVGSKVEVEAALLALEDVLYELVLAHLAVALARCPQLLVRGQRHQDLRPPLGHVLRLSEDRLKMAQPFLEAAVELFGDLGTRGERELPACTEKERSPERHGFERGAEAASPAPSY